MSAPRETQHPYPGLRPFERWETDIFFGREQQTDELLDRLGQHHFLAVIGPSGCGKSSLVRTGLIAGLEAGLLCQAGTRWRIAEFRPGSEPYARLADVLLRDSALGEDWSAPFADQAEARGFLLAALRRGPLGLSEIVERSAVQQGTRVLVVVDQFEELFRYHQEGDAASAAAFVALLLEAVNHERIYLVLTMRSDFLGDCSRYRDLPDAINRGLYLTPRLERAQLAEAIGYPAKVFGGEVEETLVNRLVNAAGAEQDQLPLLQHCLMRLWQIASQRSPGRPRITLADFEKLGGLQKALNDHADDAHNELSEAQQSICETLFRCLTQREAEGRDTRRPVTLGEVAEVAGCRWHEVAAVVEVFRAEGRHFLIPASGTKLTPDKVLDISHESLIRQWTRLQGWVAVEAEAADQYLRLADTARRWKEMKESLLQSPALENAVAWRESFSPRVEWARRYGGNLTLALDYLQRSEQEKFREQQAEAEEQRRKLAQAKRVAVGALVALLITLALGVWGWYERHRAEEVEKQRTASLFESQLTRGSLLARMEDYAEARKVLAESVMLDRDIPESRRHARNLLAGYLEIMGGTAEKIYRGARVALTGGAAVSPNGKWLAAAGERGTLALFDADNGTLVKQLEGHDPAAGKVGAIWSLCFDPQARWLYSGGDDGQIIRWSLPAGNKIDEWQSPGYAEVKALALSPDGLTLASGDVNGVITLRSATDGKVIRLMKGHTQSIKSPHGLVFSPDGTRLASASGDGTARIWQLVSGTTLHTLAQHTDQVVGVAFSTDGKFVATAGGDNVVMLWNGDSGEFVRQFRGHDNIVSDVAFSADNSQIYSSSLDNTLRLWNVASGVMVRVYQGHEDWIWSISRQDDSLYTAGNDGTVRRWHMAMSEQWFWELPDTPHSAAISPDGMFIVVGFARGSLGVYNRATGQEMTQVDKAHAGAITRLAFNLDGTLLASVSADRTAKLWRIEDDVESSIRMTSLRTLYGHKSLVHAVTFSPDGKALATASYDGQVGIFDVASGEGWLFPAHQECDRYGCVETVAFFGSGKHLMTVGYEDQLVRLWDLHANPPRLARQLAKAQDKLLWAALRPDEQEVAAVGRESAVRLYDLRANAATEPQRLIGHEQTVFKVIYSPDGRHLATLGGDMTVRIWDLDYRKELFATTLPDSPKNDGPWDFDFRCTPEGECWIAVPLTVGRLALYRLPYARPPESIAHQPE